MSNYHAPPWPGHRSTFDTCLQQHFCPNCGSDHSSGNGQGKGQEFSDKAMQCKWLQGQKCCQKHDQKEQYANSPKTLHDPDNWWSYSTRAYQRR